MSNTIPVSYKYLSEARKKELFPEIYEQEIIQKLPPSFQYASEEAQQAYINNLLNSNAITDNRSKNTGGVLGGVGYTLGSFGLGALRTLEGVYDFVGSALFSMVGQNEAAKKHFMENRWSYDLGQRLNTWYNPSKGMQFVGDVAGGIGNSAVGMAVGALTGGVGLGLTVGMGAAGGALEDAYHKTGELGFKEFGYATSVGVAEGAMESVFGAGGKVLKSLGVKSFAKQGAKQIVRQGVLRGIWDGAKGEFFEEAAQEVLDPIFQKVWGIDKDAKVEWGVKELFKEGKLEQGSVLYSGLVGAVSGGIIGGVGGTANRVRNTKAGRTIIENNRQNSVIGMNAEFAKVAETQVDKSGIWGEIIELRDAYNKRQAEGKNASAQMLGQMQRSAFAASFEPGIQQAKAYLKENWTSFVEDAAKKGYKFNGETITENMVNNEHVVTTLATQSVMGQLFMEPDTFIQQVFNKGAIDLNSFVKFKTEATPEQVYAINKALNVDILADNFNFNDFQKAFDNASKNNPNLSSDLEATFKYLYQVEDAISKQMDSDTKAPVYDIANPNLKEGVNIFRANKDSNALVGVVYDQKSDTYRIVEGQDISKPLSLEELNNAFKKLSQPIETATTQQTTTESVSQQVNEQVDTTQEVNNQTESGEKRTKITAEMTEAQRYEALKDRTITVGQEFTAEQQEAYNKKVEKIKESGLEKGLPNKEQRKLLRKLVKEFNIKKTYENKDIELEFYYGTNSIDESISKQSAEYILFAEMLAQFDSVIENAVGIEVHNRNDIGYKLDPTLKNVYVLTSAFQNGENIVPVKLEVKQFTGKKNTLYVAVALNPIKTKKIGIAEKGNTTRGVTTITSPITINISDFIQQINPKDTDLLKYVPKQFLTQEQIEAVKVAEAKDLAKFEKEKAKHEERLKEQKAKQELERQERIAKIERIEYYNKKAHEHIQNAYKNVKLFPDMEISKLARQATPVFNNLNKARQDSIKLLVHQAQQSGVDTDTIKQLVKLAAKTNYNIFITDSATSEYTNFYGQNVIYLSKGAITENGAIAKVAMHEIIHALKGVEGYQAMQDFALENMSEERKTKLEKEYRAYYEQKGLEFTEDVLNDEITATYITETLARGSIDKILNTFGRYGETGFKTMLAKFKDFKTMKERSPQISFIERKVRKAFDNYMQGKMDKALVSGHEPKYSLDPEQQHNYTYDKLVAKKDITVVNVSDNIPRLNNGIIDRDTVIYKAKDNARTYNNSKTTKRDTYVYAPDIGQDVIIGNKRLKHGLSRGADVTAKVTMNIGDILTNSIAINELKGRVAKGKTQPSTDMSYVLLGLCKDSKNTYAVRTVVGKLSNQIESMDIFQVTAIKGSVVTKKNPAPSLGTINSDTRSTWVHGNDSAIHDLGSSTISVKELLNKVKGVSLINEVISLDVADNLGIKRSQSSQNTLSESLRYSLPGDPAKAIENAAQTNDTSAGDMPINAVDLESIPGNQLVYAVPQNLDQWSNLWLKKVPPKEFFEHKKTTFKANLEAVTIQLVNKYEAIERVLRNAGMDRQTAASLTHQASTARSAAMTMLGVAQFDAQYNRVGDSLYDIFKPIHQNNINSEAKSYKKNLENGKYKNKEKYIDYNKKFDLYMLHLHNEARLGQDKSIFGEDVTVEVSKKTIADMEATYPEFKELAKKVRKYSDNLLTYRVQTGLITAEFANHLREMYPYYVPTYRAKDSGPSIRPAYGNIRGVDLNQTVKRAKGSDQAIMPIYDSLAAQTIQVINTGRANNILTHLYYASLQGDKSIDIIGKETVGIEEALSHEIKVEKDTTDKVNNKVSFYFQGEKVTMLVDKNIFTGIESMLGTNKDSGNKLYQTAVKLNSTFKNLVTSWNPFFSIWRNPIKDFGNFVINTKYGVANSMRNYKRAWQEIKNGGYYWQEAQAAGIVGSGIYNYQTKTLKRGETVQDRTIGKLAAVSEMIEMTPRLAEYISAREAGHSVEVALYQAADVTTNFGRSGTLVAKLNATVMPFLNPAVQGANKIWRALVYGDAGKGKTAKGRRLNLLVRLAVFAVAATAFNGFMNDDDEDYKNLSDYTKQANFVIPMGDGKFLKIPKDRLQAVVSSVYLRAKASAEGDEHAWKGMGGFVVGQVTPIDNFSRPLWEPIKDVKTNTTWYGGEIESQRWENVRPSQRYDTRTSEISKSLGKTFNYSPLKIDYLLQQYLGVVGDLVLPASAVAGERSMFERQMLANSTISNKWAGKLSDMSKEYTYRKNEGDVKAELALKYINKIKQDISDLYNKQNEIQADKSLSKDEKVTQSDIIQVAINALRQRAFEGGEEIYNNLKDANIEINDDNKQSIYIDALYGIAGSEYALKTKSKTQYTKAQMYNKLGFNYDMSYQYFNELDQYKKEYAGKLSDRDLTVMYTLQLSIPNLEKLILLFSQGYRPKVNEQWLIGANKYELEKALAVAISKLKISSEEKIELATMCGYKVEDGKIKLSRTK